MNRDFGRRLQPDPVSVLRARTGAMHISSQIVSASHGGQKMKSKNFIAAVLSCALLSLLTVSAFAQLGRIEGEVIKAGTTEPVANAAVSIVRMDIKGNYDLKTDKKGKFLH